MSIFSSSTTLPTPTTSSTKAELLAAADFAKTITCTRTVLFELGESTPVLTDNQALAAEIGLTLLPAVYGSPISPILLQYHGDDTFHRY
jgi:hypothetical protein